MEKHRLSCVCYLKNVFRARLPSKLHRQLLHQHHLQSHLTVRERSWSCKSQWNSIGNSSTSTTCNLIYNAGTILQLQITMEFCRPQMHETQVTPHFVEKAPCTDLRSDPTLHPKFLQNYAGRRVRQPRTPNKRSACSYKLN